MVMLIVSSYVLGERELRIHLVPRLQFPYFPLNDVNHTDMPSPQAELVGCWCINECAVYYESVYVLGTRLMDPKMDRHLPLVVGILLVEG